jgi:hypothetical protein
MAEAVFIQTTHSLTERTEKIAEIKMTCQAALGASVSRARAALGRTSLTPLVNQFSDFPAWSFRTIKLLLDPVPCLPMGLLSTEQMPGYNGIASFFVYLIRP